MENEKNINKNSNATLVWIIIGILVIAAVVITVITTSQNSRPDLETINNSPFELGSNQELTLENDTANNTSTGLEREDQVFESEDERIQSYYEETDIKRTWTSSDWDDYRTSMKESCENYNGEWLNSEWECVIGGVTYYYGIWEPAIECQNQGGTWLQGNNTCENSNTEWCVNFKGLITERSNDQRSFFNEEDLSCRFIN